MKLFIYKTLIVVFALFILFEFTIGLEIKKVQNNINLLNSERGRNEILNKVRKEIQRANKKENILKAEDRKLLSDFINKIIVELNSETPQQ